MPCDSLFVSAPGCYTRAEWKPDDGEKHCNIVVIQDSMNKCLFAHAVPRKGVDDKGYIIDCFAADIEWLGWSQMFIWSHNEPAAARLVFETLEGAQGQRHRAALPKGLCHMIRKATARLSQQ